MPTMTLPPATGFPESVVLLPDDELLLLLLLPPQAAATIATEARITRSSLDRRPFCSRTGLSFTRCLPPVKWVDMCQYRSHGLTGTAPRPFPLPNGGDHRT